VDGELIDLLLRSVDCLRAMLDHTSHGLPAADADSEVLRGELVRLVSGEAAPAPAATTPAAASVDGWAIRFVALPHLLQTGNDPLRLFRELQQLGQLDVCRAFVVDAAPTQLAELDPGQCWLGWELRLHGAVARADVAAVFDWVEGDCELTIEPIAPAASAAPFAPVAVAPPVAAPA